MLERDCVRRIQKQEWPSSISTYGTSQEFEAHGAEAVNEFQREKGKKLLHWGEKEFKDSRWTDSYQYLI